MKVKLHTMSVTFMVEENQILNRNIYPYLKQISEIEKYLVDAGYIVLNK